MKIDIDRLGLKNVTIDPETLFTFPQGIAGFEACKRFKLFHEEGKATVFWLQSVDDLDVMFPVVAPEALDIEYEFELSDAESALIGLQDVKDIAVAVIVYRDQAEGGKIAANTRSPVILNLQSRKGMQKILRDVHPTLLYRAR
jgi:flagellar assembly factor FliW